ncbi:hypothetical protein EDEG_00807 [Edhazardia aedis USNM 41457]|uniref:HTH cro/C1-type domain-containing protein n=1 Tax=Edhazardia aedis (strain USNM 41457) TaxID=1003232 RepID=J9DC91_EDHAE|nr:hypothetical protein EDEG_00807 [Edhazardia aedis USNM 41457]|eukprot:EJW05094.1 hypothetical protein EDEG_00807 [Edhazardia aedis USNM 41457]
MSMYNHYDTKKIIITKAKPEKPKPVEKPGEAEEPTYVSKDIGRMIVKARTEKKMTQKDLATKINVQAKILSEWENGKGVYSKTLADKISKVLGIDFNAAKQTPKKK